MADCDCGIEVQEGGQRSVLWILLTINASMFVAESVSGWIAESTGLIGGSLDMPADASVYSIALYAVGRSHRTKITAARLSGFFQIGQPVIVLTDVSRRFMYGSEPVSTAMIMVGTLALAANVWCLILISKHRDGEVHMRASWIFSRNDVLVNAGVIVGGVIVGLTGLRHPDLLIGAFISIVVLRGGVQILAEARKEQQELSAKSDSPVNGLMGAD